MAKAIGIAVSVASAAVAARYLVRLYRLRRELERPPEQKPYLNDPRSSYGRARSTVGMASRRIVTEWAAATGRDLKTRVSRKLAPPASYDDGGQL
jgi:hypothetical protein